MATAKSQSLARQLAEDLKLRLPALASTVTLGVDASGFATVTVGALTAGSQSAFIRIKELASIQTDSLGLSQRVYTPHVLQLVLETSTIANVALMTELNKLLLLGECLKHGVKVELYMSANTNAVDVGDIVAGNLKQTWDHLYHPMTSSQ